jgi:hypothetical protein
MTDGRIVNAQSLLLRRRHGLPSQEAKPVIGWVSGTYTASHEVIAEAEGGESRSANWAVDFVLDGN